MKFQVKSLIRIALGALMASLWTPLAGAQTCQPLTIANLPMYYSLQGQKAFELDDEGTAPVPLYFDLVGAPNPTNGTFNGTISTSSESPSGGTYYEVSGTVTQVGSSGLSITFAYSPSSVNVTTYSYTGAIMVVDQDCDLLIAGTYTITSILPGPRGVHTVTSGPYPFSGKLVDYVNE